MMKKVLTAILCGVLAVGLTACASGNAVLNEVQNALSQNNVDVNEIVNDVLGPQAASILNPGSGQQEQPTEQAVTEPALETETPSVEETTAAEEVTTEESTTAEERTTEATTEETTTKAEERTTEEETTEAEERTTEEETTEAEERTTEEETTGAEEETTEEETTTAREQTDYEKEDSKVIALDGDKAKLDDKDISTSDRDAVYVSDDIVYYHDMDKYDSGNYYGNGDREDRHTEKEAAENKVLNITEAGTYTLSGEWNGQVRVDLGESAVTDKDAKVVLILDDANILCSVAPAILFKNVYESETANLISPNATEDNTASSATEETTKETGSSDGKEDETTTSLFGGELNTSADDKTTGSSEEETAAESETTTSSFGSSLFGGNKEETTVAAEEETTTVAEDETTSSSFGSSLFGGDKEEETTAASEEETTTGSNDETKPADDEWALPELSEAAIAAFESVDTTDAGAVIFLAKGSENTITGSHVAEIYKDAKVPETETKQDGAINSYMTMNIESVDENAVLNVLSDCEGISTGLHLTINGGNINVVSAEDAINTDVEMVSVTTINGGNIYAVGGMDGEGDGIDSNGWIVVNGGRVIASAPSAANAGFDSTVQTIINGGEVVAFGGDTEWVGTDSKAVTMNLQFAEKQNSAKDILITDTDGKEIYKFEPSKEDRTILEANGRDYTGLVISNPELKKGEKYHLFIDGVQQAYSGTIATEGPQDPFGMGNMEEDPYGITWEYDWEDSGYGQGGNAGSNQGPYDDIYEGYYDNWYDDWFEGSFEDLFAEYGISMDEVEEYIETRNISFLPGTAVNTSKRTGGSNETQTEAAEDETTTSLFGSKEEETTTSLFGSREEETTTSLFGSKEEETTAQAPGSNDPFARPGDGERETPPARPGENGQTTPPGMNPQAGTGTSEPSEVFELADTVSFFGGIAAWKENAAASDNKEETTTSLFGNNEEETTTSLFGDKEDETTTSLFGDKEDETTTSLFGDKEETTTSLFGDKDEETTTSIFGDNDQDISASAYGRNLDENNDEEFRPEIEYRISPLSGRIGIRGGVRK